MYRTPDQNYCNLNDVMTMIPCVSYYFILNYQINTVFIIKKCLTVNNQALFLSFFHFNSKHFIFALIIPYKNPYHYTTVSQNPKSPFTKPSPNDCAVLLLNKK